MVVLYRPNSEFSRGVENFVKDLQTRHDLDEQHLQVLDYDSRDGQATASIYDIMAQPAVLVIGPDGGYVKHWQGPDLPGLEEIASYTFSLQQ